MGKIYNFTLLPAFTHIYRYFTTMAQLNSCVVFPPKQAFYNEIQQMPINDNDYEDVRKLFNSKIAENKWKNMSDYLKYYNLLDVEPLVDALKNCFSNYDKFFDIDALRYLSLPSIGFQSMYNVYDQNLPFVFSFNKIGDEVRKLFRDNVLGGLSTVFHRFV